MNRPSVPVAYILYSWITIIYILHIFARIKMCVSRNRGYFTVWGQLRAAYPPGKLLPLFDASYINNALRKEVDAKWSRLNIYTLCALDKLPLYVFQLTASLRRDSMWQLSAVWNNANLPLALILTGITLRSIKKETSHHLPDFTFQFFFLAATVKAALRVYRTLLPWLRK